MPYVPGNPLGVRSTEQAAPCLKATRRGDSTFHGLHDGSDAVGDVVVGSIYHEDMYNLVNNGTDALST